MTNKKKFVFWRKLSGDLVEDNFAMKTEYHAFFAKCNEHFDFRISSGTDSYAGDGIFTNVFKYKDWKIVPAESKFKPDVAYQYTKVAGDNFDNAIPLIDSFQFKNWCPDKWNQYGLLSDLMPMSFLIKNKDDLRKYLEEIKTLKAVIKPRRGQKGENIVIFNKTSFPEIDENILNTKGYILQDFYDTNIAIPSVVSGLHDIKLITIGNNVFANLRVPEVGKEFCTYDSPYTEIQIKQLPKEALEIHKKVKERIDALFPNQLYTVDIGMTKNGPIVFELNSHTAFPYIHFEYAEKFFSAIIRHIDSVGLGK